MTDDPVILQIVENAGLFLFLSCAVVVKNLICPALPLAAGSVTPDGLFFLHELSHAGAVEISAGAGMVTALLITALSLTHDEKDRSRVYL